MQYCNVLKKEAPSHSPEWAITPNSSELSIVFFAGNKIGLSMLCMYASVKLASNGALNFCYLFFRNIPLMDIIPLLSLSLSLCLYNFTFFWPIYQFFCGAYGHYYLLSILTKLSAWPLFISDLIGIIAASISSEIFPSF